MNFRALDIRFSSICRIRAASPSHTPLALSETVMSSATPLAEAESLKVARALRASSSTSKPAWLSSSRPASIFEKSSTSFRISSSDSPESRTVRSRSRNTGSMASSSMAWTIPRTPLRGVRISWLMLARNCDFKMLAASAASMPTRLSTSSFSTLCFSSALSRNTPRARASWPISSLRRA